MNGKDPVPHDKLAAARDRLHISVERQSYVTYALGTGPLLVNDIDPFDATARLLEVREKFDWPTQADASIRPVHDYSPSTFLKNLFETENSPDALKSFITFVKAKPIIHSWEAKDREGLYGLAAVVHRANGLAPDLFENLREALQELPTEDTELTKHILANDENQDILLSLRFAYRIMGRLLKVEDRTNPITDAHEALTSI